MKLRDYVSGDEKSVPIALFSDNIEEPIQTWEPSRLTRIHHTEFQYQDENELKWRYCQILDFNGGGCECVPPPQATHYLAAHYLTAQVNVDIEPVAKALNTCLKALEELLGDTSKAAVIAALVTLHPIEIVQ